MLSLFRYFLAGLAVMFITGCSHLVSAVPSASAIPAGPKIQADVGLILSDEFKRFSVSESRIGDTWKYENLGQSSAEHFRAYLESRFRKVTVLPENSNPSAWSAHGLAAVIDPRINGFTFDIPILKVQTYPASIRYAVTVYAPGSRAIVYKGQVSGIGDTAGSPGFDFAANPSKAASRAVEEGVKASVEDMLANPGVKALLSKPATAASLKGL